MRTCIKHNTLITRGPPCYLKPRFAALLARVFTPDTAHCVRASYRAQPEGAGGYFTLRIAREAATGYCALSGVLHITADGVHSAASGTCSPRPVHCMLQCYVQAPTPAASNRVLRRQQGMGHCHCHDCKQSNGAPTPTDREPHAAFCAFCRAAPLLPALWFVHAGVGAARAPQPATGGAAAATDGRRPPGACAEPGCHCNLVI